ncbi:MAG: response regulator transcription factor [Chitinophagaceae bacterium]
MKILIIEDEQELSESIVSYLKGEDYVCEVASTFNKALQKIELYDYDCIVLDITIPGGSGLDILRELKVNKKLDGVLIVSARNSLDDKVNGLTLGADDYLPKPFHLSELSARIAAIIRRKKFDGNNLLKFDALTIDTIAKSVSVKNIFLELTRKEYELLLYFVSNKKKSYF